MRIIGNEQKNNGQNFWEILERIIGKISSIIGAGLKVGRLGCAPKNLKKINALRVAYFPKIVLLGLLDRSIEVFDCSIREYRSS